MSRPYFFNKKIPYFICPLNISLRGLLLAFKMKLQLLIYYLSTYKKLIDITYCIFHYIVFIVILFFQSKVQENILLPELVKGICQGCIIMLRYC